MTLFLLAAVLSTTEVTAARTPCCVRHPIQQATAGSVTLARLAAAAPREKTAVRTEAPIAAPTVAFLASPECSLCVAYVPPALAPRAAAATPCSERAPPSLLA